MIPCLMNTKPVVAFDGMWPTYIATAAKEHTARPDGKMSDALVKALSKSPSLSQDQVDDLSHTDTLTDEHLFMLGQAAGLDVCTYEELGEAAELLDDPDQHDAKRLVEHMRSRSFPSHSVIAWSNGQSRHSDPLRDAEGALLANHFKNPVVLLWRDDDRDAVRARVFNHENDHAPELAVTDELDAVAVNLPIEAYDPEHPDKPFGPYHPPVVAAADGDPTYFNFTSKMIHIFEHQRRAREDDAQAEYEQIVARANSLHVFRATAPMCERLRHHATEYGEMIDTWARQQERHEQQYRRQPPIRNVAKGGWSR